LPFPPYKTKGEPHLPLKKDKGDKSKKGR